MGLKGCFLGENLGDAIPAGSIRDRTFNFLHFDPYGSRTEKGNPRLSRMVFCFGFAGYQHLGWVSSFFRTVGFSMDLLWIFGALVDFHRLDL
jgi:hypothetical protein